MINKITIENFKGIKDRIEIDLKPVTLLFGPNSAGKSTVIQALHYLKEILERYNTDPGKTNQGGEAVDLGGFANLVHRAEGEREDHYKTKSIKIGIEVEEDELIEPEYFDNKSQFGGAESLLQNAGYDPYYLEFTIEWDNTVGEPILKKYEVFISGEPIGCIEMAGWNVDDLDDELTIEDVRTSQDIKNRGKKPKFKLTKLNLKHPALLWTNEQITDQEIPNELLSGVLENFQDVILDYDDGKTDLSLFYNYAAFPDFRPVFINQILAHDRGIKDLNDPKVEDDYDPTIDQISIELTLSQIFSTPIIMLRDILRQFRYIGPLRTIPDREFLPERYPVEGRWSDGLGAWDSIYRKLIYGFKDNSDFLNRINKWMEQLNTGYNIKIKEYKEVDSENPLMMGLDPSGRIFEDGDDVRRVFESIPTKNKIILFEEKNQIEVSPKDIGSGVTQVFPIVVGLADYDALVLAVEQPELHVHPAIQQKIADMVISFKGPNNLIMLETHSEHIMLRLLRRIEETTENELEKPEYALKHDEVSVVYVVPTEEGVEMTQLPIDETGEFTRQWPKGFFEERAEDL